MAVRAAARAQATLADLNADLEREWSVTLADAIGVNTGPVVAPGTRRGPGRWSPETRSTAAARLEQAAAPGEILIGEETFAPGLRGRDRPPSRSTRSR